MECKHEETITVDKLIYCKKCNKYIGEMRELNPLIAEFVYKLNEGLKK